MEKQDKMGESVKKEEVPTKKENNSTIIVFLFLVCILIGVGYIVLINIQPDKQQNIPVSTKAPEFIFKKEPFPIFIKKEPFVTIDKSPQKQSLRKEFLDKLIANNIFKRIEFSGLVYVWVDDQFTLIDYQTKQTFLEVVYCYYYQGYDRTDVVILKDYFTGKEIGTYHPSRGLQYK